MPPYERPLGGYLRESELIKHYHSLSRDQLLANYDSHNGDSRHDSNRQIRRMGRCGCEFCRTVRSEDWFDVPMNNAYRKGNSAMAGINMCDRCSSVVKGVALGRIALVTSSDQSSAESVNRELCPPCVGEILAVVETELEPRAVRGYDKPFRRPKEEPAPVDGATAEELATELIKRLREPAPKSLGA